MEKEVFEFRSEYVSDIAGDINLLGVNNDNNTQRAIRDFKNVVNAGIYSNGFKTIEGQLKSVTNTIDKVQKTLKKQTDEMIKLENGLKGRAENITIPKDFEITDEDRNSLFKDLEISKEDGRSVNEGQTSKEMSDNVDYDVKREEDLKNINNEFQTKEEKYDDSTIIEKTDVTDITSEEEQEKQNLDFKEDDITKERVENIEKNNLQTVVDTDINVSEIKLADLKDINDETKEKE